MGPLTLPPGEGIDVWPHPHIGLATVTYLLDGELIHRDSLGSLQSIQPGEINWMTAGRGIAHSERSSPELRRAESKFHGLQLWVALPKAQEEIEPAFHHYAAPSLPMVERDEAQIRVLIGNAYGVESRVQTLSPVFFIDARMRVNAELSGRQIRRFCSVPGDAERLLAAAMTRLGLSARGHDRVLKVARTIADLEGVDMISAEHCAEALQYRGLDRRWRP